MIPLVIGLIVAAVGAGAAAVALDRHLRDRLVSWLRSRSMDRGHVMDAIVFLDRVGTAVRARLVVLTRDDHRRHTIDIERTFRVEDVADPEMRRQLETAGHAQRRALDLLDG